MHRFGQFQRQWGMNLSLFGAALTSAVTAPLLGLVKASADFEQAFANVVKTVESLDVDQFGRLNDAAKELREQVRGLARELPFAHKELATIASFGGQFGVAVDDLGKFTEVVAKLGTAVDGIETETAAKGLAQIITIANKDVGDNIEQLASELVHLGNTGLSTEGTILEITRRMSGAGNAAKMSMNFMMGLSAAVANLGHRSELGGTALANTILKIDRAVSRGGEALAEFAKVSKKTSEQFAADWGKNSEKQLMDLFANLAALKPKDLSATIADLFGTAARHNQVLLSLISAYPLLTQTIREGNRAFNENIALQEEFRKKATTFWNQLQVVQNRLYDIAVTLGGPFMDAMRGNLDTLEPFITKLENLAKAFEDLNPATQRLIINFGLFLASLGPIAVALGAIQYVFGQFMGVATGMGRVLLWLATHFAQFSGTLVTFGTQASKTFATANTALVSFFGNVSRIIGGITGTLLHPIQAFWALFDKLSVAVWKVTDAIAGMRVVEPVMRTIFSLFDKLSSIGDPTKFQGIFQSFSRAPSILSATSAAFTGLMTAVAGATSLVGLTAIFSDLRDALVKFGLATKTAEDASTSNITSVKNIFLDLARAWVQSPFAGIITYIREFRDALVDLGIIAPRAESATVGPLEHITGVVNDLAKAFGIAAGPMKSFFNEIKNAVLPNWKDLLLPTRQKLLGGLGMGMDVTDVIDQWLKGPSFNAKDIVTAPHSRRVLPDTAEEAYIMSGISGLKPIGQDNLSSAMLKRWDTAFDISNEIETKTSESFITGLRGVNESLKDTPDLSENARKAIEKLREELMEAQFQKNLDFEKFLGWDDMEKFTQMNEALNRMKDLGIKPPENFMNELSESASGFIEYLKVNGYYVPEMLHESAQAAGKLRIELRGLQETDLSGFEFIKTGKEFFKDTSQELEKMGENYAKLLNDLNAAKWDNLINIQTDKSTAELMEFGKELFEVRVKMAEMPRPAGLAGKAFDELGEALETGVIIKAAKAVAQLDAFKNTTLIIESVMPGVGMAMGTLFGNVTEKVDQFEKKVKKAFGESFKNSVNDMSRAFSRLSNIMGDSFDGVLKQIGDIVALMAVGVEVGETLHEVFMKPVIGPDGKQETDEKGRPKYKFDASALTGGDGIGSAMEGYIKLFTTVVQGYALMQQATDVAGRRNRVMRGGMTGASIGSNFGPWGTVIGFVVGAIWGAVRKLKWEEIGNRIAYRMGVRISEELSRVIEETAKEEFGGDMLTAETFHIGDIIDQTEITEKNFGKLAWSIKDIFVMLDMGRFTLEEAAQALDKSFGKMLEFGTDKFGFIRRELREIIALTHQWGVQSKEVQKFMTEQADKLIEAVNILGEMPARYGQWMELADRIEEARNEIAEAAGDAEKLAKANEKLNSALAEQAAMAEVAQAELENLGLVIAGNIFAAVADGRTLAQAILGARDGLKKFFDAYKALGLMPNDPLVNMLRIQSEVVEAIPNTIAGIDALGQSIVGLTNMNLLDPQMFQSIQTAGYNAYVAIQGQVAAVGGTTRDALLPMQGYLQMAEKAARELGIPLDANTQMMIDQSKELGIWKELGPSAMEKMTSALNTLIDKISTLLDKMFGIPEELPDPFEGWEIPDFDVTYPEDPNRPPGPQPPSEDPDRRAVGSIVSSGKWFEDWGAGTNVMLHNQEAVIRPDQALSFATHVLQSLFEEPQVRTTDVADEAMRNPNIHVTVVDEGAKYLVLPDGRILADLTLANTPDALKAQGITTLGRRRGR